MINVQVGGTIVNLLSNGLGYIAILIGSVALFFLGTRGLHKYYKRLQIYHLTTYDHDRLIWLKNTGSVEDPEEYARKSDFVGPSPDNDDFIREEDELSDKKYPEITIDFDDWKRYYRGELRWVKYGRVCFFTGVLSVATTGLLLIYLGLLVNVFDPTNVETFWTILALLTIVTVLHSGLRLAAFFHLGVDDDTDYEQRNRDFFNWAYSFNMTILFTLIVSFFTSLIILGELTNPFDLGIEESFTILGYAVVISTVVPLLAEGAIRLGKIPHQVRQTKPRDDETINEAD